MIGFSAGARGAVATIAAVAILVTSSHEAWAQARQDSEENRLLREAAAYESRGQLSEADSVLRRILRAEPASSGAVFALERVSRARGRPLDALPVIREFLAREGSSTGMRTLELNVLAEADSLPAMRGRAEQWMAEEGQAEGSYREIARVYERVLGPDDALSVLQAGRSALGDPRKFALEMGDLLAARGDADGAVGEWTLAIAADGAQAPGVTRRILAFGSGAAAAGRTMVQALVASGETSQRRAAARLAVDLDLGPEALEVSRNLAGDLAERARVSFLSDIARRAREAGVVGVASWAYAALGQETNPAERRQFDRQLVDVALASGDAAGALDAQRRIAESYPEGSVERRRAFAEVLRLEAESGEVASSRADLAAFTTEFRGAPEIDEATAVVAAGLAAAGDREGAWAVLDGAEGPRSRLESAFMHLDEGAVADARAAMAMALAGLPSSEATDVIQLTSLLGRASPQGADLVARVAVLARRGREAEAVALVQGEIDQVPTAERASILAEGARIAERADRPEVAAALRERILEENPEAVEVGEAALALARYHAADRTGVERAIRILEDLISSRPNAAVVPSARLELERLRKIG